MNQMTMDDGGRIPRGKRWRYHYTRVPGHTFILLLLIECSGYFVSVVFLLLVFLQPSESNGSQWDGITAKQLHGPPKFTLEEKQLHGLPMFTLHERTAIT